MKEIGQRIKYFRKRAGIKQLELENLLNSSAGWISRIESGSVIPQNTTILKIAEALKLNAREISYVNGAYSSPATDGEILSAIKSVENHFNNPHLFAYLMDERWRVLHASLGMLNLLQIKIEDLARYQGMSLIQMMFDKKVGIRQFVENEDFDVLVKNQLTRFYSEVAFMEDDVYFKQALNYIETDPLVSKIWREIKSGQKNEFNNFLTREVKFIVNGNILKTSYSREPLSSNDRFEVIEYKIEA